MSGADAEGVSGADAELLALRERILGEEQALRFSTFTADDAWALGAMMREAAAGQGLPIAISIRRNTAPLFYSALEGATADNADWLRRKCAVVDRYEHASMLVGINFRIDGTTFETDSRLNAADFAAHGGAFPVIVHGTGVVGTVAVSGLPQLQDHDFVVAQLRRHLPVR